VAELDFVKIAHPPQITGGVALSAGKFVLQIFCQKFNHRLAPAFFLLRLGDTLADFKIKGDQTGVDLMQGLILPPTDDVFDFGKKTELIVGRFHDGLHLSLWQNERFSRAIPFLISG
jgi:hypothetical protein